MNRMRPIRETITLEAARDADRRGHPAHRADRAGAHRRGERPRGRPRRSRRRPTCRRSRGPRWTATPCAPPTPSARRRTIRAPWRGSRPSSRARCRRRPVGAHQCTEIATGAPVPDGADAVVMVEDTEKQRRRHGARLQPRVSGPERHADRAPTSARASRCCSLATCSTRAASALSPPSASSTSRCTRSPAWRFSRRATRWSTRASR